MSWTTVDKPLSYLGGGLPDALAKAAGYAPQVDVDDDDESLPVRQLKFETGSTGGSEYATVGSPTNLSAERTAARRDGGTTTAQPWEVLSRSGVLGRSVSSMH